MLSSRPARFGVPCSGPRPLVPAVSAAAGRGAAGSLAARTRANTDGPVVRESIEGHARRDHSRREGGERDRGLGLLPLSLSPALSDGSLPEAAGDEQRRQLGPRCRARRVVESR